MWRLYAFGAQRQISYTAQAVNLFSVEIARI